MITDPNDTVFPATAKLLSPAELGLRKRELLAAIALQGLLADPEDIPQSEWPQGCHSCIDATAALAVLHADALIFRLNRTTR